MKSISKITLILSFIILGGCSAALVGDSSDPSEKIRQATILANEQKRPVGAIKLLKQATELAKRQGDKKSEAIAEFYIAEIYKNPGPRGRKLLDINNAFIHYDNGIRAYNHINYYKWSAFLSWNKSNAYQLAGNRRGSCLALMQAKNSLQKKNANSNDVLPYPYSKTNLFHGIRKKLLSQGCI